MTLDSPDPGRGSLENCIDDLDGMLGQLEHYSPPLLAQAMRAHLAALLHALIDAEIWSVRQVEEFLAGLSEEAFDGAPPS